MKKTDAMIFRPEFQYSVLKLMLRDPFFCTKCSRYLQPAHFNDHFLGWFFSLFSTHFEKFNKLPDATVILNEIHLKIKIEEQENYTRVFKLIAGAQVKNEVYIKDLMTDFIKACYYREMHQESAEYYNQDRIHEAFALVDAKNEEIKQINFQEDNRINFDNIDLMLETLRKTNNNKIPTGLHCIDHHLAGGYPRGAVTTVMGGYNCGKTTFLINLAVTAAQAGNKVLFTFNEGRKEQILSRFLSRITSIPQNTILAHYLNANDQAKIREATDFLREFIVIKPLTFVGVTVEDFYDYAKELKSEFDFQVAFNDYGQDLLPKKSFSEERFNESRVWVTFDQMASEMDIAVVSAAQFNREGHKKSKKDTIVRSDSVSECIKISQKSEVILTLNVLERFPGYLFVLLDKNRDGPKDILCRVKTDFQRNTTHNDFLPQGHVNEIDLTSEIRSTEYVRPNNVQEAPLQTASQEQQSLPATARV